jgi:hypothetical protein
LMARTPRQLKQPEVLHRMVTAILVAEVVASTLSALVLGSRWRTGSPNDLLECLTHLQAGNGLALEAWTGHPVHICAADSARM